jgi:hypothetical protein
MATTYQVQREQTTFFHSIRWNRAFQAALIVGLIFFLLSRGIPWVGSGAVNPAIMGREIAPGQASSAAFFLAIFGIHMLVAIIYGLIMAPIVHGFRPWVAGLVGGICGLVLYFINYAIATILMDVTAMQSEWPCVIQHIIFGIVFAETYKGMVRRQETPITL